VGVSVWERSLGSKTASIWRVAPIRLFLSYCCSSSVCPILHTKSIQISRASTFSTAHPLKFRDSIRCCGVRRQFRVSPVVSPLANLINQRPKKYAISCDAQQSTMCCVPHRFKMIPRFLVNRSPPPSLLVDSAYDILGEVINSLFRVRYRLVR
jgi:hypothetical protein